ncbi:inositol monophosphatase [Candidatus Falkowbacteria bacterium]|nr:inositol monophosphatase [Candidatus Falkowbacteria bacterium]
MNTQTQKIIKAAKAGGEELKKYFLQGLDLDIKEKSTDRDYVTKADLASEKAILAHLNKDYPDYNIHSEEAGIIDKKSDYTFVIDPLDGSHNFVTGTPNFSVAISLWQKEKVISNIVYCPITNRTFTCEKGKGVYLENQKLKVNNNPNIKKASVSYVGDYASTNEYMGDIVHKLYLLGFGRILANWSVALDYCTLASGKYEAIVNDGSEIYDFGGGKLMAREAGAKITDFNGQEDLNDKNNLFIASNGTDIHEKLLKIFN